MTPTLSTACRGRQQCCVSRHTVVWEGPGALSHSASARGDALHLILLPLCFSISQNLSRSTGADECGA
jgi:hypothetical protein